MIKAECDRCGKQKETEGAERVRIVLPQPFGAYMPRLPEGWRRVALPAEDEAVQGERKELCAECVNALRKFFEGDGAVPGLLEPETLDDVDADLCTCPQPQVPRPPCPLHESVEIKQNTIMRPECLAGQHETDPAGDPEDPACRYCGTLPDRPQGCIAHGGPDCICGPEEMRQLYHPERPHDFVGDEDTCTISRDCPVTWGEFTAWRKQNEPERVKRDDRTRHCTCAGVGFGTEDCAVHHPDGLEKGTHLKCFRNDSGDTAGECPGIYRRGMFAEHMERWHGLKVAPETKPCPYCTHTERYITELGPHIAKEHPGDWQAWIDGGQTAG
ncbi:hypothetical protein SEA_LAZERLEMON_63 [Streptomyces phage LazerLemon]|nr:hypothetical protein SEA_LAZERLEMON_63 [Streptomyces phage LazerLemon]